jgi:hypothetical protein
MDKYHVTKSKVTAYWHLKRENSNTVLLEAATKTDLVSYLDNFFKGKAAASVKIHRVDGTIEEERTYPRSADPHRTKG